MVEPQSCLPEDKVATDMLAVELQAGGVSPSNTKNVRNKSGTDKMMGNMGDNV